MQHAEDVAACHERFLSVVDQAAYTVEALKKSAELRRSFMEAGRQTGEAQAVLVAGQSESSTQATQCPAPSQVVPPLSEQGVPFAAISSPHWPASQVGVRHSVPDSGQ